MYRMSATPTFTKMPDAPLNAGVNTNLSIVLPHPNGTHLLLFGTGSGGPIYQFNGTSWSNIGTHQIGSQFWIGFTVPEYGVLVFLRHPSGSGAASAIVYKP
jgi:hypothetical protein